MNKFLIFSVLLLSMIFSSCGKDDSPSADDLKQKELELKEKELQIKEKELLEKKEADLEAKRKELDEEKERIDLEKNSPSNYSNTRSFSSSGVYPEASQRLLTAGELNGMTRYQLKIMRNEIFARHGYIFQTDDMRSYFLNKSWYKPLYTNVDNMLSSTEKKNIEFIKRYE